MPSSIKLIKKRDGRIVKFDKSKIEKAIEKAFVATKSGSKKAARELTLQVVKILEDKLSSLEEEKIPTVEEIQDIVEKVLIDNDYAKTAKAYILYREKHREIRETRSVYKKAIGLIDDYLNKADWEIKENSNMSYSLQGLNNYITNYVSREYWLERVYSPEVKKAALNGDFHIHDLQTLAPYCCGWDLYDLLVKGFGGVPGKIESRPAKHFSAVLGQVVNFFYTLQGEAAGAQAFSNFDTLLAPFIYYDNLSYREVKQALQEFIYNCNVPTRVGFQTPFTNLSFDLTVPSFYKDQPVIIGGKTQNKTYKEFQEQMDILNKVFAEIMAEGDAKGRPFTFPIPTYSITKDFNWDNDTLTPMWAMTAKYGIPYFSNFVNSDLNPEDVRSMCKLPTTEIIYKNSKGCIAKTEIEKIVNDFLLRGNPIKILINGKFKPVKNVIKLKLENKDIVKVTLDNGIIDKMTLDHPSLVIENGRLRMKESKELKVGDEFPFAQKPYEGELGDFDLGRLVGLYIGDGWISHDGATLNLVFNEKENELVEFVRKISEERFVAVVNVHLSHKHHYAKISVASRGLGEIVKEYVRGDNSLNKRLNSKIFARSIEFRKGILLGIIESDGSVDKKRNRIALHLGNKDLISDILILARSLGVNTTFYQTQNRTGEKRKMGYTLRFSAGNPDWFIKYFGLRKGKNQKYKEYKNFYGVKIIKVEREKYTGYVYDFELDSQEHTFQLANGIITHNCCHLRLDNKELYKRGGGLFGSAPLTGSIGVVTINLPRIGYLSKTKKEFFDRLTRLMDLARDSLETKRKVLERFIEIGLYPYARHYLSSAKKMRDNYFGNHFSTIGVIGGNEACLNFKPIRDTIGSKAGKEFMEEVLDFIRNRLIEYQKETGNLYNLEASPAEGTSYSLAKIDKEKFPNIITAGDKKPYYTNSTQLPVNFTDDLFEALKLQDNLQTKYTGGTVFHAFLGESLYDGNQAKRLVKSVVQKFHIPYFTLTPTFSICPVHGYIPGEHYYCPKCVVKQPCEVYSRVVGYLRPVSQWNAGKQEEFTERKVFKTQESDDKKSKIKS